jgi:hypothetical protein
MKKNNKDKIKTCPFLDTPCLKDGCQLYHKEFDRCQIELLPYNLYMLASELKKNNPDDK